MSTTGTTTDSAADKAPARGPGPAGGGGFRGGPGAFMAGRSTEKALDFKGSGVRLVRMLAPQRVLVLAALTMGAIGVGLSVLGPRILGQASDLIFTGVISGQIPAGSTKEQVIERLRAQGETRQADLLASLDIVPGAGIDFGAVGRVLILVAVIYLIASAFMLVQARLTTVAVQSAMRDLRAQTQGKLSRLPLSYFDGRPRGELLSRVTNDIDNLAQTLQQTMSQMVNSLLTIVGVLAMMLWISPLLAIVALVTVPASILVVSFLGKRAQPQFIKQWAATGRLNGHIEESYTGHALVTVFGRRREAQAAFEEHNNALYDAAFRAQFMSGLIQPAMMLIGNLNYVLVAVVGGLRVASGDLSLGSVQAFIQYSRQFSQPLTQVAGMANLLQSGIASAERVFALLDAPEQSPEPDAPARPPAPGGGRPGGRTTGRVEFDHVSFRYTPDTPLIEDLSLRVEPGQTVAIVGPTGAGKTTLVNLLMRFYEVTGGRILLDGVDIATMDREDLRANTGMVLQDAWLFGGTIAENIAYGAPGATHEQIVAAATATHVDALVRTLPEGYETVLADDAENVSAGQRQLITIARAFLAEPAILILDEATSSVDTRTEVLIQRAMNLLREGRTSFVIAHRLSTIRDADVILVMDGGAIVEQGTHTRLLAAGGAYATLYSSQFAQAAVEMD